MFGSYNGRRIELFSKFQQFVALARSFELFSTIFLDGSFVTDKAAPGDIDVVLVIPRAHVAQLIAHPNARQIMNTHRIKQTFEVHLFIQPPPSGMVEFFQSLRPDEAIRRNVAPDQRRGILEVTL